MLRLPLNREYSAAVRHGTRPAVQATPLYNERLLCIICTTRKTLFRLYFDDIAESTPLSREREVELADRIKNGDMHAREENDQRQFAVCRRCG